VALDFALSGDEETIAEVFTNFFANESPIDVVRTSEPLGFSPSLWSKLQAMEVPGMAVGPEAGGGGASLSEMVVVAERLGEALAPVPLVSHWVASALWPDAGVVSGDDIAAIALKPADGDGLWHLVPDGAIADVVVGVDGDDLVGVRNGPPGSGPANHGGMPLADRSSRVGSRSVLGPASDFTEALDRWRTLTAAVLVGIAGRAQSLGVAYILERRQFGRPIGSYQAIQHRMADFPALIDGARFLTHKAAWAFDNGLVDGNGTVDVGEGVVTSFAPLASMAYLQAGEAAVQCTDSSLHYHGGYGFSLEYDIQLYYRRARAWVVVAGDPARERLHLADLLWGAS